MAGKFDFTLDQGSDTEIALTFYTDTSKTTTINVSSYHFKMQIREHLNDETYLDELSDTNGRIDMTDAGTGKIVLIFPAATSAVYNFDLAYYDLESTVTSTITREMQGQITLSKESTK